MIHLFDLIVSRGMTVKQAREMISHELKAECDRDVPANRSVCNSLTWAFPRV